MYAASNNQIDFLQLLIKSGAKIPLSPSTMKDEAEIVRELSKITVNSEIIEVLRGCIEPDFELSIGSFDKGSTSKLMLLRFIFSINYVIFFANASS